MARKPVRTTNQIKCLLDGCDDWDVSADLPEWDSHPSIIKEKRLRPDIVIHSASTQQLIMVELTVPYENRMEEAHIYKREKYMNLTKELENAGYKAVVMPVEVGARGFAGSSVYDPLTKLSICGNKRTKALKLLAEKPKTVPGGSGAGEMRDSFIMIKNALTIAGPVGEVV